jgi:hypothetical protein
MVKCTVTIYFLYNKEGIESEKNSHKNQLNTIILYKLSNKTLY